MDSLSRAVTLLILTSQKEAAEDLIASLRNGGLAVNGIFTGEPERLEDLSKSNPFELILCCHYDPAVDLDACMSHYRGLDSEVPLVIIADSTADSAVLIDALRSGARDLTERGDTDHLQLVVARELSDLGHRRAEARLRKQLDECEQRFRDLVDASDEAVAFIREGTHIGVNPAYLALYGFGSTDALHGFPLLDLIAPDDQRQVRESLRAVERRNTPEPAVLDVQCIDADGERFEAHIRVFRSTLDGETCVRVVTQRQARETLESGPVALDADTGLPNRAALMGELRSRLAEAASGSKTFAAIYVGISVFPKLLQTEGLAGGLKAAAGVGAFLRVLAPENAFLARVCDDGYVLLLSDLRQADAIKLAASIKRDLRFPLGQEPPAAQAPQCSTGLMLASSNTRSAADLLDTLYRDYLFGLLEPSTEPGLTEASAHAQSSPSENALELDRSFSARIKHALEVDGFQLVYQPIVSLKGDSQENYNVLLRLREDDGPLREAKDFLTAAIDSGSMVAIDRWVFRNAIAEVAAQRSKGRKPNFFVNLAEQTLQEEKLLIWICDCLRDFRARGNWVTLQILEKHARRNAAVFTKLSEGLRKVKCRVALNRFGEGPNPGLLLRSLRVDYVKFPPELARGLANDRLKQRQLQELTKLCRDAGVKSVVTGVEDARSLTVLWTAGIDYVQGNFLQKPTASIEKSG